jgi:hypothetical protein
MNTLNLTLYDVLRKELNLTEAKSRNVAKAFREAIVETVTEKEMDAKELISRETKEMATKLDIAELRTELVTQIAESKTDLLKWFMGGFITIVAMLIGLFAAIILK